MEIINDIQQSPRRFEWLAQNIQKNGFRVGAEIGVDQAVTTRYLLALCSQLHLYAVDNWARPTLMLVGTTKYFHQDPHYAEKIFDARTQAFKDRLTILRGLSWEMAARVPDNSLDFVFIDADHSYECVKRDILAWTPKLKQGRLMCGHDYDFDGVNKAITELVPTYKYAGMDHVWYATKEEVVLN